MIVQPPRLPGPGFKFLRVQGNQEKHQLGSPPHPLSPTPGPQWSLSSEAEQTIRKARKAQTVIADDERS